MRSQESAARDVLDKNDANRRSNSISDTDYQIQLHLPGGGSPTYSGETIVQFESSDGSETFLDFTGTEILTLHVNGTEVTNPSWTGHRLHIENLSRGPNKVVISYVNEYDHTGDGFHQFIDPEDQKEYVYTNFEPYSAHRLFPSFDQPDIKASYSLQVDCPKEWVLIGNSELAERIDVQDNMSRHRFSKTKRFSTYLFALIGGPYQQFTSTYTSKHPRGGTIPLGFFARESLAPYVDQDELFEVTSQGFEFFEDFFDFPYPFGKYDQIFVPEFNHGAMENVGAITHTERIVFRDPPTYNQRLTRAEIILHEMAHMWFGDLVTMKWWDDLWLNESFASYMSFLALTGNTRFTDAWQSFNSRMKAWAYRQDQLVTTHPVAGEVADTDQTFLNFDGITYGKGASVIKQLVKTIGYDSFKSGMQTYMETHAFSNTTLGDWLNCLDAETPRDLKPWAASWLETSQHNTVTASIVENTESSTSILVSQSAPDSHPLLREHALELAIGYLDDDEVTIDTIDYSISTHEHQISLDKTTPSFVFPNYDDHGFLKAGLDSTTLDFMRHHLEKVNEPLLRMQIWQSLWEMVRDQQLSSIDYINIASSKVLAEDDLELIEVTIEQLSAAVSRYVPESKKMELAHNLFSLSKQQIEQSTTADERILWGRAMFGFAINGSDVAETIGLIQEKDAITEFVPDQDMRWTAVINAVAHGFEDSAQLVETELERDPTDRGQRAALRADVSIPDVSRKQAAWGKFLSTEGYGSLHLTAAAMSGFHWWVQAPILEPFTEQFFSEVEGVFESSENHFAQSYFGALFPGYRVEQPLLDRSQALLENIPESNQLLRRMLLEANDNLARSIRCRVYAESNLLE